MKILAFDTSGAVLTAALAEDGKVLLEIENISAARHSSTLVPELEKLLGRAKWSPKDIDVIAVCVGPGSFTGIRVGVATAQMLGFVWKKKIAAVSSLEAAAYSAGAGERVAVSMDARKGMIYAGLFERQKTNMKTLIKPLLTTSEAFRGLEGSGDARFLQATSEIVRASGIALAADAQARAGKLVSAEDLDALYLHPKDCNVTRK